MHHTPAQRILNLWLILMLGLGAGVHATESLMMTDIPAASVARESTLGMTAPPSGGEDSATEPSALIDAVVRYQNSINELQKAHGVYDDRIGEELTGLGLAYRNLGQYREAIEAFNRSLYIKRINHGLHNLDQIPVLEQIIATNTALYDWEALDRNYQYLYWINRRSFGVTDPRLLPVIDRLAIWHLNAYELASDPIPFKHLLTAESLFYDAVTIIEANYGAYDQRLINPLYGIALANYQMALHAYSSGDFNEIRSSSRYLNHLDSMLEQEEAIQILISDCYRAGKQAMLKVIEIHAHNPDLPAANHGIALIHLGDWYLLFNRRSTANETYALAYAKLTDSGMQKDAIDQLLAQPRSLPALQMSMAYQQQEEDSDDNYVVARFDVSKTGHARNIEIIEAKPADNESLQRRAKETIRTTRFRPRLEDGQPVETTDVNIRYVIHE